MRSALALLAVYALATSPANAQTCTENTLDGFKQEGKRVAAYGAPAKGNTLLNYCGIGPDLVEYTVDKNPLKVGTLTPGMRLPVKRHDFLAQDRPDVTMILPWNLSAEIMAQEATYRAQGGQFLVPIPEPRVLS